MWCNARLDRCGAEECARAQDDRKAVPAYYYRSLSVNRPTGGADRKPGPLQRQMGKERQHPHPVPSDGRTNKKPGHKQVANHGPIGKQACDPPSLCVDEPKRKGPNAAKRVVNGDPEHASKAGRGIMRGGERKRQQSASKRRTAGHEQDQDAAPKRESPKERVGLDPSPPRLAHE